VSPSPGEAPGTFADALRRLSGEATYLYVDGAQYWYSLRANITRLAADRANSNVTDDDADDEIKRRLQAARASGPFAAVHAFPDGPGDVTDDDDGVHLVRAAHDCSTMCRTSTSRRRSRWRTRSSLSATPARRLNRNLLVFCAASEARLAELRTAARQHLAWKSILEDHQHEKIELTKGDEAQAKSKITETDETVTQRIAETYVHVLVPEQTPGTREIRWHQTKPTGAGIIAERIARKLESEERLITGYGGTRVRMDLDRIPLWSEAGDITVDALWKAYCQFPYLPRLASFQVLAGAISDGVSKLDWQTETFAYAEGNDGTRWVGLVTAQHVTARPGGFVIRPDVATEQLDAESKPPEVGDGDKPTKGGNRPGGGTGGGPDKVDVVTVPKVVSYPTSFYGQFSLDSVRAIRQLEEILRNVVEHLSSADGSAVELTLEINAKSTGYDDRVRRTVSENAINLGAKGQEFE
jgi:hypothetical protein